MELIKIEHLTKTYKTSGKEVSVLSDVNLTLPQCGLVVILGKSGSGKSTLLNLIGKIDKPSKGTILSRLNGLLRPPFKYVSFIFQHYHLLENETPLYNVMLPALIKGIDKKLAERQARELLKCFNISNDLIKKETRLLSGGEKERIAILRALITNPRLILADEPTGALDGQNAIKTMNILKKASANRLVLLVTHNKTLAKQYADRIITLSDGRVISDETFKENNEEAFHSKVEIKKKNDWTSTIVNHNFKRRFKRNIVSIIGMTISLIFCYLLFGFSYQSNNAINNASEKHFDYGCSVIRKEVTTSSSSSLSLVKTLRPSEEEIDDIITKFPEFEVMPNYDAIFNTGSLFIGNTLNKAINFSFVYSFDISCYDSTLLIEGSPEDGIYWYDVVVNKSAYELIKDNDMHYSITYEHTVKENNELVVDYFEIEEQLNIVSIVDEFNFLSVPKIYFDYQKIDALFDKHILENYSSVKEEDVSWKDYVINSLSGDEVSSYSMRCFLTDLNSKSMVEELNNYLNQEVKLENDSLSIKEALSSLTLAASYGLEIFLVIALAGSVLIVGVFTYSAYVDDKKESSILSCLGARNYQVVGIFASEALIVTFFSFLISTVLSYLLQSPINYLLKRILDIPNLIEIPFKRYLGIKGALPIGIFIGSMIVTLLFSSIPILINKKTTLKKELSDL